MFKASDWLGGLLGAAEGFVAGEYDEHTIAREEVAGAMRSGRLDGGKIHELEVRVERLELACEGMWELMKARHGMEDGDLLAWMAEVDLRDGAADGKSGKGGPVSCPSCSRKNAVRHDFCMYCGEGLGRKPFS